MRLNVYSEELTDEAVLVTKRRADGTIFYGVRIWLGDTPGELVDEEELSAVTLWFHPDNFRLGARLLNNAYDVLFQAMVMVGQDIEDGLLPPPEPPATRDDNDKGDDPQDDEQVGTGNGEVSNHGESVPENVQGLILEGECYYHVHYHGDCRDNTHDHEGGARVGGLRV